MKDCSSCLSGTCQGKETTRLPSITSVFLILTQSCNLKCKYCFVVQKPKEMTLKVAMDAVGFIAANAEKTGDVPSINYFGGEPLLKWHDIIVPLTDHIRSTYGDRFELSMTTNGLLLDEEKLMYMKRNRIGFMVSIDGAKETQDKNRPCTGGASSFDILAPKLPLFLSYNPRMTFRATVDHDNAGAYVDNHRFAYKLGYTNMFSIVNVFAQWKVAEKALLSEQITEMANFYLETLRAGKPFGIQPFEGMFRKIGQIEKAKAHNQFRIAGEQLPAFGRCGLGAQRFASVGTDGRLYSCQEMCDNDDQGLPFVIGDIYEGADETKRWRIISEFDTKKVRCSAPDACKTCALNPICDGACAINNYFANGDLNIMPEILCYYYQCLYREAVRIKNLIQQEPMLHDISKKRGILND